MSDGEIIFELTKIITEHILIPGRADKLTADEKTAILEGKTVARQYASLRGKFRDEPAKRP